MFSQTVEYALRAAVYLATDPRQPRTTDEIARQTKVPRGYLAKVLQQLGRAKLVHSQRGLHGGFVLAREPGEISVLNVVEAVDPIRRIRECPLDLEAHSEILCPLHQRMDDALAKIEDAFSRTTLSEVLDDPNPSKPLCEITVEKKSS